ncbi:MAG: response regulator [Bacillati bacterium ANGP1]|uniref:Response regulator n=1 Tax=Candidatus Segetimicrobium genomatis TaxID=2569760 RepID=A0A537J0C9_9BACT|nr:MAG: response regulator [Terrabacteria group bacterium ANGP1]
MTSIQTAQQPRPVAARVLVVDDEESIRDLCARVLSRAGYTVITAPSGEDAVALLTREAFALVISDIRMPGISGLEVLERAKATYPEIRVVLITGFGTPQMLTRAQQSGADRILTKPFNPMELLAAVREILPQDGR